MSWCVFHVDIDQFIAAVEVLRHPELRARPVVVGGAGDPTQRGVVATASYEARRFGIGSGMPLRTAARRCPDAVFLPVDREAYETASEGVMSALRSRPGALEVAGWDEAFLGADIDDPNEFARETQRVVTERTGLTCSIGIGDNKLQAKIASAQAKPSGIFRLTHEGWSGLMDEKPPEALWGIGKKTARRLADMGISSVRELAEAPEEALLGAFGPSTGRWLRRTARGESSSEVITEPRVAKSRSREKTFQRDLDAPDEVRREVARLASEVAGDARRMGRKGLRVTVKIRFVPFDTHSRSVMLESPGNGVEIVSRAALQALEAFELERPVRLVGVRIDLVAPP